MQQDRSKDKKDGERSKTKSKDKEKRRQQRKSETEEEGETRDDDVDEHNDSGAGPQHTDEAEAGQLPDDKSSAANNDSRTDDHQVQNPFNAQQKKFYSVADTL